MRKGAIAWCGLWGGVAVADGYLIYNGHESLSTVFGGLLDTRYKYLIYGGWTLLTLHLFSNELPIPDHLRKYDPVGFVANKIPRKTYEKIATLAEDTLEVLINTEANPFSTSE